MNASSPCINICELNSQDVCIGCLRTQSEIACWSQMNERERLSIMAELPARSAKVSVAVGPDEMTE